MPSFVGKGLPLTQAGFAAARETNDIEDATLWSVLAVETSGCGFLPDRRPKILFERHIFSRLTGRKFDQDHADISSTERGNYGEAGSHQYSRLEQAIDLNETAALQSASWGLGQIMGENFKSAGFQSVDAMVTAMVGSEDEQLKAITTFVQVNGMGRALRERDWATFARRYNGPLYAENNYDGKLKDFYEKYSTDGLPNLLVRGVQVYLTYRGFSPGRIDGVKGKRTQDAARAFQASVGLTPTGAIDEDLLARLSAA